MSKLTLWTRISFVCVFCVVEAIGSSAQTFKTLVSFDGADGQNPSFGSLVQGPDGNFYGTTNRGGNGCDPNYNCGTVFKITSAGKLTTLHNFDKTDGAYPSGLVLATNGMLYGTTHLGGANCGRFGCGTFFAITPTGELTTLYSYTRRDRANGGTLVQATDQDFYGTGTWEGTNASGEVYKITAAGKLTRLYSFCSQPSCIDGTFPYAGLVQASDGSFYGTTEEGGVNDSSDSSCPPVQSGCGTVFRITPAGKLTTLYSFCAQENCTDGSFPWAGLVQASDGSFYGTTEEGGVNDSSNSSCPVQYGCGTVFRITPAGKLTTLYSFCSQSNCADGALPYAGLMQATDGQLYGTTTYGGANCGLSIECGTVFKITSAGKLTTLHSFCSQTNCADGAIPQAGLTQATNGTLYGTTPSDGVNGCGSGCGTVYSMSVGMGPFVETNPTSGKVGKAVIVLGNNLKNTSGVTFNGTRATFTVVSSTEIKTAVPSGATTGFVRVTTPKKTLKSNVVFRITK
jgi:uncharacterized repeat protein (TIGR03803 family)